MKDLYSAGIVFVKYDISYTQMYLDNKDKLNCTQYMCSESR